MPRLVFTPRYLKRKTAGQVKNYVEYIATRENAERFSVKKDGSDVENYVDYLGMRPRAERSEQGHALWNGSDEPIDLRQAAKDAAAHKGNIWTFVASLTREDAERLGMDNAKAWREVVREKAPELAEAIGIPLENFVWYGAFHNEGHHPHIHLMCYSKNPREGFLSQKKLMKLRSSFAAEIFKDELYHLYEQKDEVRKDLKDYFDKELKKAASLTNEGNPKAEALLMQLAENLKTAKHRKVYGRLDKENKLLVDAITREISEDEKIQLFYQNWLGVKDDILSTYQNTARAKKELADEPEFRNIKNMVLKCALEMSEQEMLQEELTAWRSEQAENHKQELHEKKKAEDKKTVFRNVYLRLLKNISRMIEDDYDRKGKQIAAADKKLLRKIAEKKEAQGQKL